MLKSVLIALFLGGELLALPLIPPFNPPNDNPRFLGGRGGFYGDVVFNRYLDVDEEESNETIKTTQLQTYSAYIALDFWESLELFSTLGATHFKIDLPLVQIKTESDLSWSIGLKAVIWNCDRFVLAGVAHYFSATSPLRHFHEIDLIYREWQIGGGATYQLSRCINPYAGLKIGRTKLDFNEGPFPLFPQLGNRRWLGGIFGVNFLFYDAFNLSIEGRFGDEAALHINSIFCF